jgi:hypothetical protein
MDLRRLTRGSRVKRMLRDLVRRLSVGGETAAEAPDENVF